MKVCSICKQEKSYEDFSSNGKKYKKSSCKKCNKEKNKAIRRTSKRAYLHNKYSAMKERTSGKSKTAKTAVGKKILPRDVFVAWALSNSDFHAIFDAWVKSGYKMSESPSIDRIDVNEGYELANMQFIPFKANSKKDRRKEYSFISPNGQLFDVYGLSDFCKQWGLGVSNMCMVASGKADHHKGWRRNHANN